MQKWLEYRKSLKKRSRIMKMGYYEILIYLKNIIWKDQIFLQTINFQVNNKFVCNKVNFIFSCRFFSSNWNYFTYLSVISFLKCSKNQILGDENAKSTRNVRRFFFNKIKFFVFSTRKVLWNGLRAMWEDNSWTYRKIGICCCLKMIKYNLFLFFKIFKFKFNIRNYENSMQLHVWKLKNKVYLNKKIKIKLKINYCIFLLVFKLNFISLILNKPQIKKL